MQNKNQISVDIQLIIIYFLLISVGWAILYSASSKETFTYLIQSHYFKQLLWITLSIVGSIIIIFWIKTEQLFNWANWIYPLVLLLTLFTAVIANPVNGARSWLRLGPFNLQPAEFLKYGTALIFAKIISRSYKKFSKLKILILAFIPVVLSMAAVLLQSDMGTTLTFTAFIIPAFREGLLSGLVVIYIILYAVFFFLALTLSVQWLFFIIYLIAIMTFLAIYGKKFAKNILLTFIITLVSVFFFKLIVKVKSHFVLTFFLSFVISSIILFFQLYTKIRKIGKYGLTVLLILILMAETYFAPILYNQLEPHQKSRIEYFIHPQKLKQSDERVAYNIRQAILSISVGGFWGRGYMKGTHNKLKYVPEQDKDYIFCTVAEEFGFIGSVAVFLLFLWLLVRIIIIAERQKSVFARVYAYSTAGIIFMHFAINIGSTLSLLPVIGIPLPFFSYGGSAMLNFSFMLATLLNFDSQRNLTIEEIY